MSSNLATNYEILVKTEPFLRFKKELFKKFLEKNKKEKEEVLRRKFYKIIDFYLGDKEVEKKSIEEEDVEFIIKELDTKFKQKNEGSFLVQGENIGYIENGEIRWIRYSDEYKNKEIETFL